MNKFANEIIFEDLYPIESLGERILSDSDKDFLYNKFSQNIPTYIKNNMSYFINIISGSKPKKEFTGTEEDYEMEEQDFPVTENSVLNYAKFYNQYPYASSANMRTIEGFNKGIENDEEKITFAGYKAFYDIIKKLFTKFIKVKGLEILKTKPEEIKKEETKKEIPKKEEVLEKKDEKEFIFRLKDLGKDFIGKGSETVQDSRGNNIQVGDLVYLIYNVEDRLTEKNMYVIADIDYQKDPDDPTESQELVPFVMIVNLAGEVEKEPYYMVSKYTGQEIISNLPEEAGTWMGGGYKKPSPSYKESMSEEEITKLAKNIIEIDGEISLHEVIYNLIKYAAVDLNPASQDITSIAPGEEKQAIGPDNKSVTVSKETSDQGNILKIKNPDGTISAVKEESAKDKLKDFIVVQ